MKFLKFLLVILMLVSLASCSRPFADFTLSQEQANAPSKISFTNSSKNAESYQWELGDGTVLDSENPEHRYLLSGKYVVKLRAKKGKKESVATREIMIDPPKDCLVEISTSMGNMIVKLYEETPLHRDNFLKLADEGFYDGLIFHRVIEGFMVQGGDPLSKNAGANTALGSGGPGYKIDAEFVNDFVHKKGALAAARQGDGVNPKRQSSGSQFYIVQGRKYSTDQLSAAEKRFGSEYSEENRKAYQELGGTPQLDYQYTVFGEVIEGLDVIDKLASVATNGRDRPKENVTMKVRVIK